MSSKDEMAHWAEGAALSDDLSLIPKTHMMEGDNWLPKVVFISTHMHYGIYVHTYVHTL